RKLWLSVSTEVFITETLHDLIIPVKAGYHQQLLEGLRRLWQRVELTVMQARGHYKVTRSFGSGFYKHRRLYFNEILAVQILACLLRHFVTELQAFPDHISPEVEVAVFHAEVVSAVSIIFYGEWRYFRRIQYRQLSHLQFDFTSRYLVVLGKPFNNSSFGAHHIFTTKLPCCVHDGGL